MSDALFDKIWSRHVIAELAGGISLLGVDRHFIHDLVAGPVLADLEASGRPVLSPDLTFATPDHAIETRPGLRVRPGSAGSKLLDDMRTQTTRAGIRMFDVGQAEQGIVHVIGPELGLTLPGALIVCGDSHTCTHGGVGALAFGIGQSEVLHVLATQSIRQRKPRRMRLTFDGVLPAWITAKDLILFGIGRLGTAAGRGCAIEYAGPAVRALDVEARLTLCNLSIEMGAKIGMVAPDDTTFAYLAGRRFAPRGRLWDEAVADWRRLPSDNAAVFDVEHTLRTDEIVPQITWGTSPQEVIGVDGRVPDPGREHDLQRRNALIASLDYMGLTPGQQIEGLPVDWVFIGSCANSRLSDLREAARVVSGRHVAPGVRALVVPGSQEVKRSAEAEGLDAVFRSAGFEWRESGCSLCLSASSETVGRGERTVSTSNRNFVGRQGPGARTHLASPAMAAAAAISGAIADVRKVMA